jgi:hypothetical protein
MKVLKNTIAEMGVSLGCYSATTLIEEAGFIYCGLPGAALNSTGSDHSHRRSWIYLLRKR